MKLTRPRAIWFDLDGTLLDSAPDLGAAANALRHDFSLPSLPLHHYRVYAGAGGRGMLAIALALSPKDVAYASALEAFLFHFEARNNQSTRLFPEVPALLQTLQQRNIAWGIVTNKSIRFARSVQTQFSTLQTARAFVCGDSTAHMKPHPAPLLHACVQAQIDPQVCWYVGDDIRDIQAAHSAEMLGIAAAWGYLGKTPIMQWSADIILQTPLQLLNLLDQIQ